MEAAEHAKVQEEEEAVKGAGGPFQTFKGEQRQHRDRHALPPAQR